MHMRDGGFGRRWRCEQNICCATICLELAVHGHVDIDNYPITAEYLVQVGREDVLGQFLNDNFGAAW